MKNKLLLLLCCASVFVSGCAAGITRTGYKISSDKPAMDSPHRPITIQCNAKYNTNNVVFLGSIHAYDTGFSTDCDEAAILDIFCREGGMVGADLINITEESQPSVWTSTCYRARANFLRFKDREQVKDLVSDAKYAPGLIIERSTASGKRNRDVIIGAVAGGLLGAIVVAVATEPYHPLNSTNSIPAKGGRR